MEEKFFKFSLLKRFPELIHGISNRHYGDMRFAESSEDKVAKNREAFFNELQIPLRSVVYPKLNHSANILIASEREKGKGAISLKDAIADTDALITRQKGIYLMVTGADCLPIMIYDPIMQICGIIHAGWRGIAAQIIPKTVAKMKELGAEPTHMVAGIGPGICQKHFVVKKDVLDVFVDLYPSATFVRNHDGYVNLKQASLIDLKNSGLSENNIEIASECTICNNGLYGSYRKEGPGAPAFAAVIGIRE